MNRFARFVVHRKILVLVVALLLAVPSVFGMIATHVNYDILTYLPADLPSVIGERVLEYDYNLASTAMITVEHMTNSDVLNLKSDIAQILGVEKVLWIDDFVDLSVPTDMLPADLRDTFFSGDATMFVVTFSDTTSSKSTMDAISAIKKVLHKDCYLAGLSAVAEDTKELADSEVPFYVLVAVALVLVVLYLGVESALVPLIFLAGIGLAILYNFGTNIFLGQISYITQSLATVLQLGVTMDFSIFLLHRYDEEKKLHGDNNEAMVAAIEKTFSSIAGSSLTTIAGFLALCTMSLTLGRDIGIVMAKGVLIGVISTVTILPALLMLFDRPIHRFTHRTWIPRLNKSAEWIVRWHIPVLAVFLVVLVPFIIGNSKTQVYYNLIDALPDSLVSVQGTEKLKEDFNMTATDFILVDQGLPAKDVADMTNRIQGLAGVEMAASYEKYLGAGIPDNFLPSSLKDMVDKDGRQLILVNSVYEPATDAQNQQLSAIEGIVKSYDSSALITGEAPMTKDLVTIADRDFRNVTITSVIAVFVILIFVFHSFSVPAILVLTIEGAIMLNMGMSYYTGTVLPFIASIVVGTIQLGATVDYAILLTNRFREERIAGRSPKEAAVLAVKACSRSIFSSGLAFFAATIGVSFISNIELLQSLCLLIARGALISMITILLVLPALLILCSPLIEKTTFGWLKQSKTTA